MPFYEIRETERIRFNSKVVTGLFDGITREGLDRFSPAILGLGNLDGPAQSIDGICAFFDLKGFTSFSSQQDSESTIPAFLSKYHSWFFDTLKQEHQHPNEERNEGTVLWHDFPIFVKFLGDGFTLVWNSEGMNDVQETNIVGTCSNLAGRYISEFLASNREEFREIPGCLRCGIAKGKIFVLGDNQDFVGPVVNLAARLQKLGDFVFAWRPKFFKTTKESESIFPLRWNLIRQNIRGFDMEEEIYVNRTEI